MNSDEAYDNYRQNQLEDAAEKITRGYLFVDFWWCTDGEIFTNYDKALNHQYLIQRSSICQEHAEILSANQVRRRRLKKRLRITRESFLAFFHRERQKYF